MSTKFVRETILNFMAAEMPSDKIVDLTSEMEELSDLLEYNNIGPSEDWIGVQFIGSTDSVVDIRGTNNRGVYRENGVIYIHVVSVAKLGGHNAILDRAEVIRALFRGQRINTILIEEVSPPNFGNGISLNFEGGYTAAMILIDYQNDVNL